MAMDPTMMDYEDGEAKDAESPMENSKEVMKQKVVDLIKQGGDPDMLADHIINTVMGHSINDQETEGED